jgi:hypothetical protein
MADSLEDVFRRVSDANIGAPKVAQPEPALQNPMPRWQRVLATTLPEVGASIAAAPTTLYALAGMGANWASNKMGTGEVDIGQDAALNVSKAITDPVREMSNKIAGEKMSDNLLSGDPLQVGTSWLRLALGAGISAPAPMAAAITRGAAALKTGTKMVDDIGAGGLKVLEALTPITISTKPSTKVAATNVAVAGALGSTLEHVLGPDTTVAEAKTLVDEKAKGALDVAAEGAKEVQRNDPKLVQAGFTGDPAYDAMGVGLLGAAALAYWRRGAVSDAWTGVKNNLEKRFTGYDPADPTNKTLLNAANAGEQQFLDRNAGMRESLKAALKVEGLDKNTATKRADQFAEYAAARTGASVNTRNQIFMNEGRIPDSAIQMPPPSDWFARYRALDEQSQDLIDRALHSRRELDTRMIDKVWHNLSDTQSRELDNYVRQVQSNPQLNHIYEDFLKITRGLAEYTREQKRFSNREVTAFLNKNPNFVPERADPGSSYLNERNIGMGRGRKTFEELGKPAEYLPKYIDEVVRSTEGKKIQRGFMTNMERMANRGNAYASKVIEKSYTTPPPNMNPREYVHWRNSRGESRWTKVNDAIVGDSLRGVTNPSALQMANGAMSQLTRLYESGSVGSLAAATGSTFFAPTSALYTATLAPVIRDRGVAVGYLDKYMQELTGKMLGKEKAFGVRGDFATFAPDVAVRMAQNVGAVLAQRISKTLHNSVITDGTISQMVGPKAAALAAKSLDNHFKRSAVHDLQTRGVLGPASMMSIDPAKSFKDAEAMLRGHGLIGGSASFLTDILHAISSAPAMSVRAMNKGRLNESDLSAAMRNMAGDPARSGAFRKSTGAPGPNIAAEVTNATPWGNIFLQSTARFAKQVRKDPAGAAMGVFNTVAVPAIGATIWNASQDDYVDPNTGEAQSYSDYQFNVRTPDKTAASLYIAIPGLPPEQGVEIAFDPLMRGFKWASELLAGSQLGMLDNSFNKPENADMKKAFKDMVSHRAGFGEGSVTNSVIKGALIPPVPPAAKLVGAIGGMDIRDYTDIRAPNDRKEGGFTEGEGKNPQATFMDQYWPGQTELIMRSVGSGAFANIWNAIVDTETQMKEKGFVEGGKKAAANQLDQAKMRTADSTKMIGSGPLFDTFLAVSPATEASGSIVKGKLEGLRNLQQALQQATLPGGVPSQLLGNKKQGFQEPIGANLATQAPDLEMMQLAEMAGKIYKQLADAELGSNKIHYDQMQSIRNSTRFSPEDKRALLNEQSYAIIANNRKLLQDIERHEAIISSMFGRPVKFDKIDLGKMLGQQAQ